MAKKDKFPISLENFHKAIACVYDSTTFGGREASKAHNRLQTKLARLVREQGELPANYASRIR